MLGGGHVRVEPCWEEEAMPRGGRCSRRMRSHRGQEDTSRDFERYFF